MMQIISSCVSPNCRLDGPRERRTLCSQNKNEASRHYMPMMFMCTGKMKILMREEEESKLTFHMGTNENENGPKQKRERRNLHTVLAHHRLRICSYSWQVLVVLAVTTTLLILLWFVVQVPR